MLSDTEKEQLEDEILDLEEIIENSDDKEVLADLLYKKNISLKRLHRDNFLTFN